MLRETRLLRSLLWLLIAPLALNGCHPTYPKEKIEESIIKLCRKEYKIDVKVGITGRTVAIYLPLSGLLDSTFAITKEAGEKINDVILSVSRVTLSTDAKFDFYCLIAHDIRIPEVQIVVIKSVPDIKSFLWGEVSRGEYAKRMLIDLRLNPQSQKERAVKDVFEKMSLGKEWQDQVMNEFFRSSPAALGDIGYWGGRFYIKDITIQEFLSEQIAARIRMESRENKRYAEKLIVRTSRGQFISEDGRRFFRFEILADPNWFKMSTGDGVSLDVFRLAVDVASRVLHGYKFADFDVIEIVSQKDGRTVTILKEDLEAVRTKKMKFEDIVK